MLSKILGHSSLGCPSISIAAMISNFTRAMSPKSRKMSVSTIHIIWVPNGHNLLIEKITDHSYFGPIGPIKAPQISSKNKRSVIRSKYMMGEMASAVLDIMDIE